MCTTNKRIAASMTSTATPITKPSERQTKSHKGAGSSVWDSFVSAICHSRTVTLVVFFLFFFGCVFLGQLGLPVLYLGIACPVIHEFANVARIGPERAVTYVATLVHSVLLYSGNTVGALGSFPALLFIGYSLCCFRADTMEHYLAYVLMVFLSLWGPYLLSFGYLIALDASIHPVFSNVVVLTEMNDANQYFSGRLFGRRKVFDTLSPNKTFEGYLGGTLMTLALGHFLGQSCAVSFLICVAGTVGDLMMSKLKRVAQVKDMGSLLPGHGGMCDRVDSLLLAFPAVYALVGLGVLS